MTFLHDLRSGEARKISRVGAKAVHLSQISQVGISVPETLCIDTELHRRFLYETDLHQFLESSNLKDNDEIQKRFVETNFPPSIQPVIKMIEKKLKDSALFAIRSSSSVEDNINASFAGVFASEIGLQKQEIKNAIRKVWASAHYQNVMDYSLSVIGHEINAEMGILIQPMIEGYAHGVVFSKVLNEEFICIEVQKQSNLPLTRPSYYLIDRIDFSIAKHYYGSSDINILDKEIIDLICKTAIIIESIFEKPQDIEWIIDDCDKLWILQARPITVG